MINSKKFTKVGVVGFGGYIPKKRIKVEEIAKLNSKDGEKVALSLGVSQKSVADRDEDAVSLAVEAGQIALARAGIKANKLGAILVGSESHPYVVKPSGTIVADILGVGSDYFCADLEFACKAGTTGIIMIASMIEAGLIESGLAIGTDVAQSKPGDVLEYTAGAGAGAIILGSRKYKWYASLENVSSYNSDTADFWRREGEKYPEHAGRFTGEPGYFKHVIKGIQRFLEKNQQKISSFDHVVLHMPNGKFPKRVAKRLRVSSKQLEQGFLVEEIGNPYSASSMLGLVRVFEKARKGENILLCSYGSGAGSDSFSFKVSKKIRKNTENKGVDIDSQLKDVEYISYTDYLKNLKVI
ncbi:MAG: hydroxymethylglutaryl-CoA synthase [Candidatus Beckwithbacteria bacterium]